MRVHLQPDENNLRGSFLHQSTNHDPPTSPKRPHRGFGCFDHPKRRSDCKPCSWVLSWQHFLLHDYQKSRTETIRHVSSLPLSTQLQVFLTWSTRPRPCRKRVQIKGHAAGKRTKGMPMCSASSPELSLSCKTIVLDHVDRRAAARDIDFRLRCALEYARCNLRHDLSLQRLAIISNVSVWHICRLFRDELGISPARYVKLLRLKCAADLLGSTSLSVKEVAAGVGINDVSHFVRDFRNLTGEFPVEYRTQVRKQAAANVPYSLNAKSGQ